MDHVKKQRGRRPKKDQKQKEAAPNIVCFSKMDDPTTWDTTNDETQEWTPHILHLRDQRKYVVLDRHPEGWLVAEMNPDFGKMGEVHFWRKEFIEEIKRRNYIIPERK